MAPAPQGRRILVVDDMRSIHEDFRKILAPAPASDGLDALESELFETAPAAPRSRGRTFTVDSAYQGEQALEMVKAGVAANEPYELAFVDMRMPPGWDGVQTVEKLWEVDPNLQVVICTAYSDYSWEDILTRLGVSDRLLLLKKPFDTAEVAQLAAALTEKWHLTRHAHLKLSQLRSMVEERTDSLAVAHRQLQTSETRYALAAAGANDGLWDWDLESGQVFFSPRWAEMLGAESVAPRAEEWLDRLHPDDTSRIRDEIDAFVRGDAPKLSCEYRILHADGQYRWMLCRAAAIRGAGGRALRAAGSQADITDRKMAEAQLRHDAFHDRLTGLPNRSLLTERLERCVLRQKREPGYHFAVMFVDLDRFKVINDSLGHLVGDRLLVAISDRLRACVRETDSVAHGEHADVVRMGGDEFVLLLDGLRAPGDAVRVAERLLTAVREPITVGEHVIHASLSIGIATSTAAHARAEDILRDADTALYRAKSDGRGRYRVFSDDLHAAALARWEIENELRGALERDELFLEYQPIVDIASGRTEHFEALVRWRHPERGVIPPSTFIPIAEESGLIVQLGAWVLERACRQAAAWREEIPGCSAAVTVNVAAKQFARAGFVEETAAVLAATGLPSAALKLEVTESSTMDAKAIQTCSALRELGIDLLLDDFGTGYSSLSYLHRMPIQALKIDRSFVSTLSDGAHASIVQAIVVLATALGIRAVAEGVETPEQLERLRSMGCTAAQGYLFAKPLAPEAAASLLSASPPSPPSRTAERRRVLCDVVHAGGGL